MQTTGPISIAAYMRQCLTSPDGGYYTTNREGRDQFGKKGDFVTSPEISQVFGELLGIWLVAEWQLQGRKKHGVEIIEFGPGRGTLMDDILRVRFLVVFPKVFASLNLGEDSQQLPHSVKHRTRISRRGKPFATERSEGITVRRRDTRRSPYRSSKRQQIRGSTHNMV